MLYMLRIGPEPATLHVSYELLPLSFDWLAILCYVSKEVINRLATARLLKQSALLSCITIATFLPYCHNNKDYMRYHSIKSWVKPVLTQG